MGQPTQVVKRTSGTVIDDPLGPAADDEHREEGGRQDDDEDLVGSHVVPRFRGGPFLPMILVYHRWNGVFTCLCLDELKVESKILEHEAQVFRHVPGFRMEVVADPLQSIREGTGRLEACILEDFVKFKFGVHLVPPYGSSVSREERGFHGVCSQ